VSFMRGILLTLVLSILGAAVGAWAGAQYVIHRMSSPVSLHDVIHEKLHLTGEQYARIGGMEREHAARRGALEAEMRAANAQLAQALQEQHAYSPQVQAAIDRFHHAMGELQKETIVHVLAMRTVLTPAQTEQFDQTVVQSLTEDPR